MFKLRAQKKYVASAFIMMLLGAAGIFVLEYKPSYSVRTGEIASSDAKGTQKKISLDEDETSKSVTSPVYEAEFEFNAVTPYWEEKMPENSGRKFYLRVSDDAKQWTEWIEVATEGAIRDDEPNPDMTFIESPLFIEGRHFQYRLELSRADLDNPAPSVSNINLAYMDSRKPAHIQAFESIQSIKKVYASTRGPEIVSRADWGSPDPKGELFKDQSNYWQPTHKPARQVFIHHTVNSNSSPDPAAVVRGIWHFHTYTRGWGDIGYNYLIDHNGTIYEGRFGGDNVVAGHVYEYNAGSLGIAMIGCYDSTSDTCSKLNNGSVSGPSASTWSSLTNLLSWKMTNMEIDPLATQSFCKYNGTGCLTLSTIAGHNEANNTSCPGNGVINNLGNVRNETDYKMKNQAWNYSARQDNYARVDLSGVVDATTVTMRFKNTGTSTWSNTTNRLLLKTAVPAERMTEFQGEGWLAADTPAVLNEASVAPGALGTFTVSLKRPPLAYGFYPQYWRLVAEGIGEVRSHFMVPVDVYCTVGTATNRRAEGAVIRYVEDGSIYIIEGGKKRHVPSFAVAANNGYDIGRYAEVSEAEINLLENGPPLTLREGTLLQVVGSPHLYILDETAGETVRRWVSSGEVMKSSGMTWQEVLPVSQSFMETFPEAAAITTGAAVPDGRLINTAGQNKLYVVQDGKRRWITSPDVYISYGYAGKVVGTVTQEKLDQLVEGHLLQHLRTGTVTKSLSSAAIYITEARSDGSGHKRLIPDIKSYYNSGFYNRPIIAQSQALLDTYTTEANYVCHQ